MTGVRTLLGAVVKRALAYIKRLDKLLLLLAGCCSAIGITLIYSLVINSRSQRITDAAVDSQTVKVQLIAALAGLFLALIIAVFDYRWFSRLWFLYLPAALGLTLLTFTGLGISGLEGADDRAWIDLGFITFQPSDIAKFTLVVFVSGCMAKRSSVTFASMALVLVACGATCALIMAEPNMSVTVCVGLVTLIMLFLGGAKARHFALLGIPALALVIALIAVEPYRLKRIAAFLDPWSSPLGEGYQLIQSYYALGLGGLFGVGLFNSRQKYLFLPFAESDFIFSVIGEELGFVGCIAVMAVFGIIVWRGALIAMRAESRFDCYLAAGITAVIGVQALLNIAVVTGSIPPTGLPLPFVSAGGTSLLMFTCAVAVLQRVASKSQRLPFGHKMY